MTHIIAMSMALRTAGLDVWTSAEARDCPHLIYVRTTNRPGWLRLEVVAGCGSASGVITLPAKVALRTVRAFYEERPEFEDWASDDEAELLWQRLANEAETVALLEAA